MAIGKSAPWFILGVMLFSFAVRSVYMESSSMFVRGGVYVVVRDAMGPFVARLSVSSLIFDYILTGPISVVTAGQYLGRLLNELSELVHSDFRISPNGFSRLVQHCGHHLFLVEQYQGHSRIEQQGAAHHADHDRHGGGVSDLVPHHAADERRASAARADSPEPAVQSRRAWAGSRARSGRPFQWWPSSSRSDTPCSR